MDVDAAGLVVDGSSGISTHHSVPEKIGELPLGQYRLGFMSLSLSSGTSHQSAKVWHVSPGSGAAQKVHSPGAAAAKRSGEAFTAGARRGWITCADAVLAVSRPRRRRSVKRMVAV